MHPWVTAALAADITMARMREIEDAHRVAELLEGRRHTTAGRPIPGRRPRSPGVPDRLAAPLEAVRRTTARVRVLAAALRRLPAPPRRMEPRSTAAERR